MCGIVGIRQLNGDKVDIHVLSSMMDSLIHRGPDDSGVWSKDGVAFGHRRLSIIDVERSTQPMRSYDGNLVVCFNGEIFNYADLRRQVSYPFTTSGDTEVLLAAYQRWGPSFVERLRGQFAFALYDASEQVLRLYRDRLGILPLYWHQSGERFVFASEIKALLRAMTASPSPDHASLGNYLAQTAVPAPYTLFRGVRKLEAGHMLTVDVSGIDSSRKYWSVPTGASLNCHVDKVDAVKEVAEAVDDAVASAMVADVAVGAYLSGGVDSSLIVALMRRRSSTVHTFSAGFNDSRYDESVHARHVSRLLDTKHHEVTVGADDFQALWPALTWHRDAPISQPADVAVYRLAQVARQFVKVVLSGEGSDELFGGYPKHRAELMLRPLLKIPSALRRPLFYTVESHLPAQAARARVAARVLAASKEERRRTWFAPFDERERAALLPADLETRSAPNWGESPSHPLTRILYEDCHSWLSDNLLERGDRMSMAASLELRPPFLDHRVVELAFRLPPQLKIKGGRSKWLVKQVARQYLPDEIVDRRKIGFQVPLDQWFRHGLRDMAGDLLDRPNSFVAEVFDRNFVRTLLRRHEAEQSNEEKRIWTLLGLEVWYETFFANGRR